MLLSLSGNHWGNRQLHSVVSSNPALLNCHDSLLDPFLHRLSSLLKDWGIDGELNFHDNEMRGFIDVDFKKKISLFDDEMAFYVPQDILLQVIKLLAKECLNIEKDDFTITCRDNSIVIDVITSKMAAVYLYNEDITTIANIGCELSIENVDGRYLRFVMSF